jgi:plastocyanin
VTLERNRLAPDRVSSFRATKEESVTRTRIALVIGLAAAVLAVAGCGSDDESSSGTTTETETATETTGTGTAAGTKLIGTVGSADDPNAFTISLTTEDGAAVTSLPAGDYTLEIKDLATIHNFHLTGPGDVDVKSEVGETEDENYDVTLVAGTYDFVCDPHAGSMNGNFEVTG